MGLLGDGLPSKRRKDAIRNINNPFFVPQKNDKNLSWKQAKRKYPSLNPNRDYDGDGFLNKNDCKPLDPSRDGILEALGGAIKGVFKKREVDESRKEAISEGWKQGMKRPNIAQRLQQQKQVQQLNQIKEKIKTGYQKGLSYMPNTGLTRAMANPQRTITSHNILREQIKQGKVPLQTRRKIAVIRRTGKMLYPNLPSQSISSSTSSKSSRGRGRPKGSVKYPGGIYNWRKMQRAAKAAAKYQTMLRRAQAIQQYPKMVAQREYNQQVQQQQVPQEVQGYEEQIPQQQVQQQDSYPQYQQEPQKRPITSIFKSSGGSPYPPVNPQQLQPASANPDYVQYTDAFTGQVKWKKLPAAESWISRR